MIASQLILFIDELSFREKQDRYIYLLKLIWSRQTTSHAMSLAGLSFALAGHDILRRIWKVCLSELLPKEKIGNLDAIIAMNVLRSRYTFMEGDSYQLSDNASEIERDNHIMLGGNGSFKNVVRQFITILHCNPSNPQQMGTHTTELRKKLNEVINGDHSTDLISFISDKLQLVEQVLVDMQNELFVSLPELKGLSSTINRFDQSAHNKDDTISEVAKNAYEILYSKGNGLVRKVGSEVFRYFADSDDFDNNLIGDITRGIRGRWNEILSAKGNNQIGEAQKRWYDNKGETIEPVFFCSSTCDIQGIWLYCDLYIRQTLEDTLTNVYYAARKIKDPWTTCSNSGHSAHLWWRIKHNENHAVIETANASGNKEINLKHTVSIAGLERAGGSIHSDVMDSYEEGNIAYTIVRIPLHSAFIKERG